jgi:hypothetical protein
VTVLAGWFALAPGLRGQLSGSDEHAGHVHLH